MATRVRLEASPSSPDMRLPPTPPDDNAHKSGLSTPPTRSSPLTPDGTPPGMLALPRPSLGQHASLHTDSFTTAAEEAIASPSSFDGVAPGAMSPVLPLEMDWEKHVSYIPFEEPEVLEDLLPATGWMTKEQHVADVIHPAAIASNNHSFLRKKFRRLSPPLPIRQAAKAAQQDARRSVSHPAQLETLTWNDLPPDMLANNRVYKHIQHHNMDRLEALRDGNAIEAVVVATEDARTRPLRHIKKRHSLRTESEHDTASSHVSASRHVSASDAPAIQQIGSSESLPVLEAELKRELSLRHKKAFGPSSRNTATSRHPRVNPDSTPSVQRHSLRHERRPLSADGKPQTPSHSPTQMEFAPITILKQHGRSQLRHSSLPLRLEDTNAGATKSKTDSSNHELRRTSQGARLENLSPDDKSENKRDSGLLSPFAPVSNGLYPALSPSINSHRFMNTYTPLSGISDRTEMEVCEAKNVALFSHSNQSVLLINSHASPAVRHTQIPHQRSISETQLSQNYLHDMDTLLNRPATAGAQVDGAQVGGAQADGPPEITVNGNAHTVDSPLINPRAPPAPPAIQFIPPTPSSELDRQLMTPETAISQTKASVQRSGSLINRARRLSGSIINPLFTRSNSVRNQQVRRSEHVTDATNDRLHPMWVPNYIWDDDEYESDDDYNEDDFEPLPRGGDTSDHPAEQSRSLFPRQMSVRMPGFRGNGGFMVGNSLGVDRHGTNKRRHHVELPVKRRQVRFPIFSTIKERMKAHGEASEEAAREKRRAHIRSQIGLPVVHHI